MFLRNAWYVAAWESEITAGALVPRKLLGEDVVLYRLGDGRIAALEDACAHRKLPLSMGRLLGDEVECGYHGLRYDCAGACTVMPGSERIHTGAKVRAYRVELRYGLVWIWMGDANLADPATIFAIEQWGDPAWGVNRGESMALACNYLYVTDNLLDPTHVAFVHRSTFAGVACEDTPVDVKLAEDGVTVSRWMRDVPPAPFYAPFLKFTGRCDRKQHYEVRFPSHAIIKAIFTPAGSGGDDRPPHAHVFLMDSYNFMTPVDEGSTRYYWFQMRNFAPGDADVSKQFSDGVRAAFDEDRLILNAVQKGMHDARTAPINLKIDAGSQWFRKRLAQMIEAERVDGDLKTKAGEPS